MDTPTTSSFARTHATTNATPLVAPFNAQQHAEMIFTLPNALNAPPRPRTAGHM
jgi:hypothetical protein